MGNRGRICRLCSQKCVQNFKNIEGNVKEAVEILLPKINLAVSDAPVMCTNCAKTLEKCSDFKWTCLCRHRSMVSCVNSKDNVNRSLKYLHLIKEENHNTNSILQHNTCGLCTNPSNSCSNVSPDMEETKIMLRECFPELVLSISKICTPCYESLESCFHFITKCSIVEEKIQKYGGNSSINDDGIRELNHPPRVPIQLEQISCNDRTNSDEGVAHRDKIFVEMVNQNCHYLEQFMSEDMSSCQEGYNTADIIKEESMFLEESENNVKQECENLMKKEDQDFNDKGQFTPENLLVLEEESNKLDMVEMEVTFFKKEEDEGVYETENCIEMEEQKLKNLQFRSKIPSMIDHNQIRIIKPDETLYEGREAANDKIELKHEPYLEIENQKFNSLSHFTSNNLLTCEEDCTKFDVSKIKEIYSEKGESKVESEKKYLVTMEGQRYDHNDEVDVKPDLQNFNRYEDDMVLSELEADPLEPLINHMPVHKDESDPLGETMYKCDSCSYQTRRKNRIKTHLLVHKSPSEVTIYNCDTCSFQTKYKFSLKVHMLTHKDPSEVTMYKCDSCSFQTKQKVNLKHHLLKHMKDSSEVTMYNCEYCSFETKCERYLTCHSLKHKDPSEVTMYKCDSCQYQAKRKASLICHMLIHKDPSDVTMYNCDICSFQTKYKKYFNNHLLTHRDPSQVPMYNCDLCSYQTGIKRYLRNHLLTHKDLSEVPTYNCEFCSYQTRIKRYLTSHLLTHKDPSEVPVYNCDFCSYQTGIKRYLTSHLLTHNDPSQVPMYNCDFCSYQTGIKRNLTSHLLTHKDPSEVPMYNCDFCSFQTRRKGNLKSHSLIHKDLSEVPTYNCDFCSYQTGIKRYLREHMLTHKDPSEVPMYNCDFCPFQTRRKRNLESHSLTHKDPSEVPVYNCDFCLFHTRSKRYLREHMLTHKDPSEVPMHNCDLCSFQTRGKSCLTKHMLKHKDPSE